ncbi:MAG: A/G-specific adenine glycosylase [Deltaproteobacteria bacterium RBG_13_65_10]|nr:MAG: A/G-specific adenine glycosylase [Deltaproteobacteria bacterium RBG_13_65_10]
MAPSRSADLHEHIALPSDLRRDLHRRLLTWYRGHARDLPWRRTRDPYAVWISEIMLQQTQVRTVLPFYERFMARFPDLRSLAEGSLDDVLGAWAGLGYYSRARNLHAAARQIAQEHGGKFPKDESTLRGLPGVGRYTAGAILSIAFGGKAAVLDGNVARVLARLFAVRLDPRSTRGQGALWDLAERLVPGARVGAWNQALMELGAMVCLPDNPTCLVCPVKARCEASTIGEVDRYPVRAGRRKAPVVEGICVIVRRGEKILFVQRPEKGLLGGLWEFPTTDLRVRARRAQAVRAFVRGRLGLEGEVGRRIASVRHIFTHRDLRLHLYPFDVTGGRLHPDHYRATRWIRLHEVGRFPLSALTEKVFERLGNHPPPA